jgi:hypothetical protein
MPHFLIKYGGHQSSMQSIEDLCRRAACKLSPAKFKGATHFLIKYGGVPKELQQPRYGQSP